jgi:tetratricopeptide (TPR) repeat protein
MTDRVGPDSSRAHGAPAPSIHTAIAAARRSEADGDWTEALATWQQVMGNFPDSPMGVSGTGTALRMLRRFDEADACYAVGLQRFPESADVACGYARVAAFRGEWNDAVARWEAARARFADSPAAIAGLAMAMQHVNRLSEAEELLDAARERFHDDRGVMVAYARIAAARSNWPEALLRWRAAIDRYPDDPSAHVGIGQALRELLRFDEADEILQSAGDRFPKHAPVFFNFAWTATKRHDWAEALRRWALFRQRFEENDAYFRGQGYARFCAQLYELDTRLACAVSAKIERSDAASANSTPATPVATPVAITDAGLAKVLTKFESLGDDFEFGLVQRQARAEPMGLFRWARIPTRNLLNLLKTRFDGVGQAEFTDLYTEVDGEFWTKDTRYNMKTRTFVYETDPLDERRKRFAHVMGSRFRFLRDQLIEDLETASKIFVIKSKAALAPQDIEALYTALNDYGPNWLLYVRSSDARHRPGSLRRLHDRLMIGHVIAKPGIDHVSWRQVCVTACALRGRETGES